MEPKEPQEQYKKENASILSLFSSEDLPNTHQRRAKSDPIPVSNFSFQFFSDKNMSDEPLPEYSREIKSSENPNKGLLSTNSYGFKGRSPYASSSNTSINIINNDTLSSINDDIFSTSSNTNSNEKIINGFIFTELKDKVLEYRCSVCNFVTNSNSELHKHLAINKHFIFPKKYKKNNKSKVYHKQENNRLNQTFMFTTNKTKKYSDKKIICKHCSKRFESNYALNSHLNAHRFKCDICYKLFNNKEDLINHKHSEKISQECFESLYDIKKSNKHMKKEYKSPTKKMEIDDWEDVSSNKKDKWESDDEINKNDDFEKSYAFIEDSDENFDFNKMVKVNDNII